MSETSPSDMDIMMYVDGELSGAEEQQVKDYLSSSTDARAKSQAISQVGELVAGKLELDADVAEERLAGLWSGIAQATQVESAQATQVEIKNDRAPVRAPAPATPGLMDSLRAWLSTWQSNVLTGAVAALAVVVVMRSTRPTSVVETHTTVREAAPPIAMPVVQSLAPEVEKLEVYDGTGMILSVPGDEDGDEGSAVIWISNDTDVVEEPI